MKTRSNSISPAAPTGFSNVTFQEIVEDGIRKVSAYGGGGGGIIRTPFDQEPASPTGTGDFYDNADVISRYNGSRWETHGPIFPLERPLEQLEPVTAVFT